MHEAQRPDLKEQSRCQLLLSLDRLELRGTGLFSFAPMSTNTCNFRTFHYAVSFFGMRDPEQCVNETFTLFFIR